MARFRATSRPSSPSRFATPPSSSATSAPTSLSSRNQPFSAAVRIPSKARRTPPSSRPPSAASPNPNNAQYARLAKAFHSLFIAGRPLLIEVASGSPTPKPFLVGAVNPTKLPSPIQSSASGDCGYPLARWDSRSHSRSRERIPPLPYLLTPIS